MYLTLVTSFLVGNKETCTEELATRRGTLESSIKRRIMKSAMMTSRFMSSPRLTVIGAGFFLARNSLATRLKYSFQYCDSIMGLPQ